MKDLRRWTLLSKAFELNRRGAGCLVLANRLCQTPPVHQCFIPPGSDLTKNGRQTAWKRKLPTTVRFSDELQTHSQSGPLWTTFKRLRPPRGAQAPDSTHSFGGRGKNIDGEKTGLSGRSNLRQLASQVRIRDFLLDTASFRRKRIFKNREISAGHTLPEKESGQNH